MSIPPLNRPPHEEPEENELIYGDTPDRIIQGHKYDGIKEYDNPMPAWWIWVFVGSIVFGVVYFLGINVFGFVDTYQDDLAESQDDLRLIREAYAAANPTFEADEASIARFVEDAAMIEAGAEPYATYCAACHGAAGEGLIGPNLTDAYWIHGSTNLDMFNVISAGILDKGMPAWDTALSPEERAQVVAFVRSLEGTNPPNAKEPQGELVE